MPPRGDALVLFHSDALRVMRAALATLESLRTVCGEQVGAEADALSELGATGIALAMKAYDETDDDLLNPEAEEMVLLMEGGMETPDLADAASGIAEILDEKIGAMRAAIAHLETIVPPADGMVRILTSERAERAGRSRAGRSLGRVSQR